MFPAPFPRRRADRGRSRDGAGRRARSPRAPRDGRPGRGDRSGCAARPVTGRSLHHRRMPARADRGPQAVRALPMSARRQCAIRASSLRRGSRASPCTRRVAILDTRPLNGGQGRRVSSCPRTNRAPRGADLGGQRGIGMGHAREVVRALLARSALPTAFDLSAHRLKLALSPDPMGGADPCGEHSGSA